MSGISQVFAGLSVQTIFLRPLRHSESVWNMQLVLTPCWLLKLLLSHSGKDWRLLVDMKRISQTLDSAEQAAVNGERPGLKSVLAVFRLDN